MKLNKILISTGLAIPAVVTPLGLATSCSQTWGYKTPISIGSASQSSTDNPFYNFLTNGYVDLDGKDILKYVPSNYSADVANSAYYSYYTPIKQFWKDDGGKVKETDPSNWTNDNAAWYSSTASHTTTFSDKNSHTQTCYQNAYLAGNTSFTGTIGQFISKYITYAFAYQASQFPNQNDLNISWGGNQIEEIKKDKTSNHDFIEWLYANANAHANGKTEAYLKTSSTNFNYLDMPLPAYNTDKTIHADTVKLLAGEGTLGAGTTKEVYYSTSETAYKDKDNEYTTYTYPSVPVLVRATNATQRYLNPTTKGSHFVTDYYQDDQETVKNQIGKGWSSMSTYTEGTTPTIKTFDIEMPTDAKKVDISVKEGTQVDARLASKDIRGTDFVAFITYYYTDYKNDAKMAEIGLHDSVSIGTLQTIVPAFVLNIKDDMFKKANTDVAEKTGWIVDVSKADDYSSEFLNLLNRSSKQGRIGQASKLNDDSKKYLQFLAWMFTNGSGELKFGNFVKPVKW